MKSAHNHVYVYVYSQLARQIDQIDEIAGEEGNQEKYDGF